METVVNHGVDSQRGVPSVVGCQSTKRISRMPSTYSAKIGTWKCVNMFPRCLPYLHKGYQRPASSASDKVSNTKSKLKQRRLTSDSSRQGHLRVKGHPMRQPQTVKFSLNNDVSCTAQRWCHDERTKLLKQRNFAICYQTDTVVIRSYI